MMWIIEGNINIHTIYVDVKFENRNDDSSYYILWLAQNA
jgi:hypothetical protein